MRILNYLSIFTISFFLHIFLIADDLHVIQTSSGITSGIEKKGVISWHDIPYAEAPINELRWKAPRDFNNKNFIIQDKKNNFCVQRPSSLGGANGDGDFVGSEDCLYLDIRKPKNSEKNLPVMFWIHGGGNTSGLKDIYDFSGLVKNENIVVVSINYRLGPFGWFSHPSIQDLQGGIDKTSNFGTLDIIKALEWVNKNISKFGGDKNNITIFGESAGGHNVLSLLVAPQAKGLFHKAVSQSGYTTSVNYEISFNKKHKSVDYINSEEIIKKIFDKNNDLIKIRSKLLAISAYDFYSYYSNQNSLREIPLMTNDGIVIPKEGLYESLKNPIDPSIPVIAGSNRDEVKLWIGTALYFVQPEYSFIGSIIGIPRINIVNPNAFEAFNYYRSSAWQLRGVVEPLNNLSSAGAENLFAYRYDWDDHRRRPIADFKKIIGAAHATEIPLIAGNNKLVGNYGFIIYPNGPSKRYTSKNMMRFWANFARTGKPGASTNNIEWVNFLNNNQNVMILDKKKNLSIKKIDNTYQSLIKELELDNRVTNREKCVILYQMGVLIGNDIYEELEKIYSYKCNKDDSVKFLLDNASFVSY